MGQESLRRAAYSLLELLDRTVRFAFEDSALYERLYRRCPRIRSMADFQALPQLTKRTISKYAEGLSDCLCAARLWGQDGILDTTTALTHRANEYAFATVENTFDFERRYARVHGILAYAGVASGERLLIVCDAANVYFASDLEDVLTKWEVTILIRDGLTSQELTTQVRQLEPGSILLATCRPFGHRLIPPSCRKVLTLMGRHSFSLAARVRTTDVYTKDVLPWAGARREQDSLFRTNECFLRKDGDRRQLFLEGDSTNGLLVTALAWGENRPLFPLVRFASRDMVTGVVGSRFKLLK